MKANTIWSQFKSLFKEDTLSMQQAPQPLEVPLLLHGQLVNTAIISKIHPRAKSLRLRVKAGQILLTLPPYATQRQIHHFIENAKPWLSTQLEKQPVTSSSEMNHALALNGQTLSAPLLNIDWQLHVSEDVVGAVAIGKTLYVPEKNTVFHVKAFIKAQAKIYLPTRLALLSEQYRLPFNSCTIRHAQSRWGSCSSKRGISLNAALLLLPTPLLDYVMLHELCHTIEMNHSERFWQLMHTLMPDVAQRRHALKAFKLPDWWHD